MHSCVMEYKAGLVEENMPEEGIEPSLPEGNRILNPARLPIPPLRHEKPCFMNNGI